VECKRGPKTAKVKIFIEDELSLLVARPNAIIRWEREREGKMVERDVKVKATVSK
jgi:hypothetical protein